MEGRRQFKAEPHDLLLPHMDERRGNFDVSVARAGADKLLKSLIIGRTAVRIAGTVLLHRPDQDGLRAQDLGPADGGRQEMRVAKRYVGDRNLRPDGLV